MAPAGPTSYARAMRTLFSLFVAFSFTGCFSLGASCEEDGDCNAGEICGDSPRICEEGCRDDDGCPDGQICNAIEQCQAGCRENAECPDDQYCDTTLNSCETGCRDDDDCEDGQTCSNMGNCY